MSIHNTTAPRAGQAEPEVAEPARRASRFDERGIALQTVIIIVVLLAIAGGIAAVLFSRASESTAELEATAVTVDHYRIKDEDQCKRAGGAWDDGKATSLDLAKLQAAFDDTSLTGHDSAGKGFCKPDP